MSFCISRSVAVSAIVRMMKPPASPSGSSCCSLLAQALALGLVLDALRDADVRVLRQVDEQPAGEADLRRQPRALGADRVLDHLHQQRLALVQDLLDRARVGAAVAVLPVLPDVGDVQERRALEADLDERALHAGQHARDAAEVDVADEAARARALDVQLLHDALLEHRDARFLRRYVDEDFMGHRRAVGSRSGSPRRRCSGPGRAVGRSPGAAVAAEPAMRAVCTVAFVIARGTPIRASSAGRLEQRQAHDARVAALEARDERRGRAPGSRSRRPCRTARRWRRSARSRRRRARGT